MRRLLRRFYMILRSHWGYWRYGRQERRARRVVVARPSSEVYDTENALFPSRLPAGYVCSAAPFVPPSGPEFVPYASCAQLTTPRKFVVNSPLRAPLEVSAVKFVPHGAALRRALNE